MTESGPLPDNTVHSRFLDYTADREKQTRRALFKQDCIYHGAQGTSVLQRA